VPVSTAPDRRGVRRALLAGALLLALATALAVTCRPTAPFSRLPAQERRAKLARDGLALKRIVSSLESLMARARQHGLLALSDETAKGVETRRELRAFFSAFLDYAVSLDAIRGFYDGRARLPDDEEAEAFLLAYTADLALYVNTAELLRETTGRRTYEVLLDEPAPEQGVPAGAWKRLKTAFNLQPWRRPLVLAHVRHKRLERTYEEDGIAARHPWLAEYVRHNWRRMMELGAQESPEVAVREWGDLVREGFTRVWFPAQKGVAEWMGDTRTRPGHHSLVRPEQIPALRDELQPGDVLVERRNWYLSNVGLPGFWPHAALYLGTPDEARTVLGAAAVDMLRAEHPDACATWDGKDPDGHPHRVIEAVSEGVIFTSLEHSAGADYVAALRPRLDAAARTAAIGRAFSYLGRPYDFEFDFLTDAALVCTELVYKAYEPTPGRPGLRLPLARVLGRPTLPANELIRLFDAEAGRPDRQLDFVAFLDGREKLGRALEADEAALRQSWRRPKWDLAQP